MVDFGNKILSEIEKEMWHPGVTMKKSGTLFDFIGAAASSASAAPFQVTTRTDPDDPTGATFQAKVSLNSDLLLSLKPNDNLAITGLDTWFPFIANDVIAIYIVVSTNVAISATIQSYGAGNTTFDPTLAAWSATDNSYVFDDGLAGDPQQIGINFLIAYSTPDADGNPFLIQACSNHLVLQLTSIDGFPALFPFPAPYRRYGITI